MATFRPSAPQHPDETGLAQRVVKEIILHAGADSVSFEALVRPGLDRRSAEWQTDIAKDIGQLAATTKIDVTALAEDPAFIDVVLKATTIAMTTSQHRKRAALRAAVLNATMPGVLPLVEN